MRTILQQGLLPAQLDQLVQLCEANFDRDPITSFILKTIFKKILTDFWEDEQAPNEDYKNLNEELAPCIIEVWESPVGFRQIPLERLIRTYNKLIN